MKKLICVGLALGLSTQALAVDLVVTKQNKRYRGTFQKRSKDGLVLRTVDGTIVVIPQNEISKIYREDKSIWDFETGTRYYLKKSLPFLPFIVLGVATGAFAVYEFNQYQESRKDVPPGADRDYSDESKKHLAFSIVSGLFAVGSIYVAFRPMEIKIPLGKINLSASPTGIRFALHF